MDASLSCIPLPPALLPEICNKDIVSDYQADGITNLSSSQFTTQCCLPDWQKKYAIKYRWEIIQAPSKPIDLEHALEKTGTWITDEGDNNANKAEFIATKTTFNTDIPPYIVQIQAIGVNKGNGKESAIATTTLSPDIVMGSRITVQLMWQEGCRFLADKDCDAINLDLRMIRKTNYKSPQQNNNPFGRICESCNDISSDALDRPSFNNEYPSDMDTICWWGVYLIDNQWGGDNFTTPETIDIGPIDDANMDGLPDYTTASDEFIVMVNYNYGALDTVHFKVDMWIDGQPLPISSDDTFTNDQIFEIHPYEWFPVAIIKWDAQALPEKHTLPGAAVVTAAYREYPICTFPSSACVENPVPVWDKEAYAEWIAQRKEEIGASSKLYTCRTFR